VHGSGRLGVRCSTEQSLGYYAGILDEMKDVNDLLNAVGTNVHQLLFHRHDEVADNLYLLDDFNSHHIFN
jgi:hypothetical protein